MTDDFGFEFAINISVYDLGRFLDWIYPRRCVHCRRWGDYLCEGCYEQIPLLAEQFCPACGKSSVLGWSDHGCRKRSLLNQHVSLCWYRGVMRTLINQFKFPPRLVGLGGVFSRLIKQGLDWDLAALWEGYVVVPVPLHSQRLRERGFNQSEVIAQLLAEWIGVPMQNNLLERVQTRLPQSTLDHRARRRNVRGVFGLVNAPRLLLPQKIILVDDVYTTGSTLNECARILKQEGVGTVCAFTLARGGL